MHINNLTKYTEEENTIIDLKDLKVNMFNTFFLMLSTEYHIEKHKCVGHICMII